MSRRSTAIRLRAPVRGGKRGARREAARPVRGRDRRGAAGSAQGAPRADRGQPALRGRDDPDARRRRRRGRAGSDSRHAAGAHRGAHRPSVAAREDGSSSVPRSSRRVFYRGALDHLSPDLDDVDALLDDLLLRELLLREAALVDLGRAGVSLQALPHPRSGVLGPGKARAGAAPRPFRGVAGRAPGRRGSSWRSCTSAANRAPHRARGRAARRSSHRTRRARSSRPPSARSRVVVHHGASSAPGSGAPADARGHATSLLAPPGLQDGAAVQLEMEKVRERAGPRGRRSEGSRSPRSQGVVEARRGPRRRAGARRRGARGHEGRGSRRPLRRARRALRWRVAGVPCRHRTTWSGRTASRSTPAARTCRPWPAQALAQIHIIGLELDEAELLLHPLPRGSSRARAGASVRAWARRSPAGGSSP